MAKIATVLVLVVLLLSFLLPFASGFVGAIDQTAVVDWVVDGDTFNVTSGEIIRLADVDTPESDEAGYSEAKSYMINLLKINASEGRTVFLDIDDLTRTDSYGRLVCVVYVDFNSSHYLNVNKALLEYGYADVWDHSNNEFSPSNWELHVQKDTLSNSVLPTPSITVEPTTSTSTTPTEQTTPSTTPPHTPNQTITPTQSQTTNPTSTSTPTKTPSPTPSQQENNGFLGTNLSSGIYTVIFILLVSVVFLAGTVAILYLRRNKNNFK